MGARRDSYNGRVDEELIAQLAATPRALAHLVAEATDEQLDASASGQWPARTILAHFRDDEYFNLRVSVERMLAEDDPLLFTITAPEWEARRSHLRDRKDHLLADFALQRQASLGVLRLLQPEGWGRHGHSARLGAVTVAEFVGRWVQHDREHVAQLEAALGETLDAVLTRRMRPPE